MKQIRSQYVRDELAKLGIYPNRSTLVPKRTARPRQPEAQPQEPGYYAAMMHVRMVRHGAPDESTWFNVRDAFIAGYKAGLIAGAASNGNGDL